MANVKPEAERNELHKRILLAAATLFLKNGYEKSSVREIADTAGVHVSALVRAMKTKEHILYDMVEFVLAKQFEAAARMINGITDDKILFYAAETTLQLYMAESNEHIREIYSAAYSLPDTSALIMHTITGKLEQIFGEHLPELETKDFYELEIASGGIMRNFMIVPCDMYFTMERKVRRFIETTFRVYKVSEEKIEEAIAFVSKFDYPTLTQNTINNMLAYIHSSSRAAMLR